MTPNFWAPACTHPSPVAALALRPSGACRTYERAGRKSAAVTSARKGAENYLLERRMFRSLRTGEVIDKRWLRFSFPTFWHYDVLRGLDHLRNAGIKPDSRVGDAIKTVIERRHQNGRWPLNVLHPSVPRKVGRNQNASPG